MTARLCALALSSAGCMTHPVETPDALGAGALVRVTRVCGPSRQMEACPRYSGALVSIDADTLRLRPRGDTLVETVPAAQVTRLEVRRGSRNVVLPGAAFGLLGGAIIGMVATAGDCSDVEDSMCFPSGTPYGMLIGVVAGGVVGALIHPDRWLRVAWPPPGAPRPAPPQLPSSPP